MYAEMFVNSNISHSKRDIYINAKAELFNEHFEDYPIVPGAFSLHLCISEAIDHIKKNLGKRLILRDILKVRFVRPILPNMKIHILIKKIKQMDHYEIVSFEVKDQNSILLMDGLVKLGDMS